MPCVARSLVRAVAPEAKAINEYRNWFAECLLHRAGVIAAAITTPLDVAKTRIMLGHSVCALVSEWLLHEVETVS